MRGTLLHAAAGLGVILGAAVCWSPAAAAPQKDAVPASAPASLPTLAQLMALAFPGWGDGPGGRLQVVPLPRAAAAHAGWGASPARVLAEPRLVLVADATHLTLVAGMLPAGEDGKAAATQLTPIALAAYQFELRDGSWEVSGRQGIFAWRGFSGMATLRAVALSNQRQGLGVEYGSCWDGYCGTWVALYELHKGAVRREPAVEMALSGINLESAADCPRRLQPPFKARTQETAGRDDGAGDSHDCYAIASSWSIDPAREQPGDLVIHYQGAISRGDAPAAAPVAIDQRHVLRYGSGKYRAVSGFNPVPPI
jgi:hypothetical protein